MTRSANNMNLNDPFSHQYSQWRGTLCYLLNELATDPINKLIEKINEEQERSPRKIIVCAQCNNPITSEQDKVAINNTPHHVFTNPYGYTFHITCFKEALGCVHEGPLIAADTWFPGYFWRYALCSSCHAHLGWFYTSDGNHYFYGLINNRILNIEEQK